MGRGPGKSGLLPHPLTPTEDHKSREIGERGTIKIANIPKETRDYALRLRGQPGTKSSGFGKNNDYRGARVGETD